MFGKVVGTKTRLLRNPNELNPFSEGRAVRFVALVEMVEESELNRHG